MMRVFALRQVRPDEWQAVSAPEVMDSKRERERFRDITDFDLMLRHHGSHKITPHFEIEPRWNKEAA